MKKNKGIYIIPCYNNENEIIKFIQEVLYSQTISFDIYIVVNSLMKNESFKSLKSVRLLFPESNLGYIGALNYATKKIVLDDYSFICFSNTDLMFDSNDLLLKLSLKLSDDSIGVISPTIISTKTNKRQNPISIKKPSKFKVKLIYFLTYLPIIYWLRKKLFQSSKIGYKLTQKDYDCYALHGSFFMFSSNNFNRYSFEHNQLLYGEEIFIAEQSQKNKLKLVWSDTHIIYHNENSTTSILNIRRKLKYIRKAKKYILKNYY